MNAAWRIGVMGAGAVGCYVGGRLTQAPGLPVVFVGRDRTRDELRASGLTLTDLDGGTVNVQPAEIAFETTPEALSSCDVVLCCVKSRHTGEVGETLARVMQRDAIVISLQNGVGNAEVLRRRLPDHTVLAGIVGFNVVALGKGVFRHTTKGALMVEASPERRIEALLDGLSRVGFEVESHVDLRPHQWTKLLVNLSNAVSALSGAPTRDMVLEPGYRRIVAAVMNEGVAVLRRAGHRTAKLRGIPVGALPRLLRLPTPLVRLVARQQLQADPEARSSMWQDLDSGRATEVDYLNGEIVRIAERHGVPAPINRRIVELVHEVEGRGSSPNMSAKDLARGLLI